MSKSVPAKHSHKMIATQPASSAGHLGLRAGMHLHLMGIGGIGMSGLASICLERGYRVSGCDAKSNGLSYRLQQRGATVWVKHDVGHLDAQPDVVVYSSAVSAHESELRQAQLRGLPTMTRGQLLAALACSHRLIAVAGAHGKTTTSGMAAQLLIHAGWDPTVVVGGMVVSLGANAREGGGRYFVAETDESDGSFLHLHPFAAIITNIDREHLNYYRSFDRLVAAFQQFVDQVEPSGALIWCADGLIGRLNLRHPAQMIYGLRAEADVMADRIRLHSYGSHFRALYKGRALGTFRLQVPGRHNVLNALGVIALGLVLDLPLLTVREALAAFCGTERRFQVVRLPGDIWFVEDYAHHPAEIQATLSADPAMRRHRLVVFQPHRYSRTQSLEREFTMCFDRADGVIVTDIYPAFEAPIPGVSGERLAGLIRAHGHPCVRYVPKQDLSSYVSRIARAGDTIFFLGAGDIGELCRDLASHLHSGARAAH